MNCKEFSHALMELARPTVAGGVLAAEALQQALEHAGGCLRCAGELAVQRDLSRQLQLLGQSAAVSRPARRHEAALRAAFRARRKIPNDAAVARAAAGWKPAAMAAAALLILAVASVLTLRVAPGLQVASARIPATKTTLRDMSAPNVSAALPSAADLVADSQPPDETIAPALDATVMAADAIPADPGPPTPVSAGPEPQAPASPAGYEPVAEFFPLLYGGDPMLAGPGRLVRVEVSGAMLQSLGFPIVGEPSPRRIPADLIVGEDGLARAIRFVP
ncbi:MAG TPA: hypothetical protein VNN17_09930 [Terriglobia bacterium]|nr:hypothetical protein [Terriglobia bacterium]